MRQTIIYYSAAREENASSTPPVVHDFTTLDTSKNIFIAEIVCQKDFSYLKNMKNLCFRVFPLYLALYMDCLNLRALRVGEGGVNPAHLGYVYRFD